MRRVRLPVYAPARVFREASGDVAISRVVEGKSLGVAAMSVPKNSHSDADRVPERSTVLRWMQDAQKATATVPHTDIVLIAHQGGMGKVSGSVDDAIVQEMIRIAMQRLSTKQSHPHVTKKKILKVLFQVRERLHHKNPVKSHLAYYWYKDGPYSEKIYAGIEQLVQDGIVRRSKTDSAETYRLVPERALLPRVDHDDHIDKACSEIRRVVEEGAHVGRMIRDIYVEAPFELYGAYNLEFKPKFESHLNGDCFAF